MELTEKELLLLDCFMYSDIAPKSDPGTSMQEIIEQYTDPKTGQVSGAKLEAAGIKCSGSMTHEQMAKVMNDIGEIKALTKLKITATTEEYEGSIRAACFVDESGNATVAFRGTGGSYQQWSNNLEGYGDVSQATQDAAKEFIDSLPYDGITVTGHSNGGNQAMYVTITCSDKVDRCVSYEGQGVSQEFALKYADEIAKNKHKIKNICGSKDFVNPLLLNIAGETVYVKSDANLLGGLLNHGAYGIYTANKDALDANGGYFPESAYVEQEWYCKGLHGLTVILAHMSELPIIGKCLELFTDMMGVIVGLIMGGLTWDNILLAIKETCEAILQYVLHEFTNFVKNVVTIIKAFVQAVDYICDKVMEWCKKIRDAIEKALELAANVVVDTYKLKVYEDRLKTVNKRITKLDERLDSLYWKVGLLGLWNLIQADLLTGYSGRLSLCANYLSYTAKEYESVEKELSGT